MFLPTKEKNYLNLGNDDFEKQIFRIMPVNKLKELFEMKQNTLIKTDMMDDPFENFILRGRGRLPNGRIVSFGMRDSYFVQWWTFVRESDAIWRIYTPDKNGVKIRTTIPKLFESLYGAISSETRDVTCFIGKIAYLHNIKMKKYLEEPLSLDSSGVELARQLLFKRQFFRHEKEVRLIYGAEGALAQSKIFRYEINPYELIEQIVFDPRMEESLFKEHKEYFRNSGFKKRIYQSSIYRPPENIIKNIL